MKRPAKIIRATVNTVRSSCSCHDTVEGAPELHNVSAVQNPGMELARLCDHIMLNVTNHCNIINFIKLINNNFKNI